MEELPTMYSVEQLYKFLGISRATAYRLVKSGEIPSIRLGRRVLISREHLLKWIDERVEQNSG